MLICKGNKFIKYCYSVDCNLLSGTVRNLLIRTPLLYIILYQLVIKYLNQKVNQNERG